MADVLLIQAKSQREQILGLRANMLDRLKAIQSSADELKVSIAQSDELLMAVEEFIHGLECLSSAPAAVASESGDAISGAPTPRRRASGNSKKEHVAATARKIIVEAQRPVSRTELYKLLTDRGLTINGANPEMVLSTMLWRSGADAGVIRLRNGGYWLRERAYPDAGYMPGESDELVRRIQDDGSLDELFGRNDDPNVFG